MRSSRQDVRDSGGRFHLVSQSLERRGSEAPAQVERHQTQTCFTGFEHQHAGVKRV